MKFALCSMQSIRGTHNKLGKHLVVLELVERVLPRAMDFAFAERVLRENGCCVRVGTPHPLAQRKFAQKKISRLRSKSNNESQIRSTRYVGRIVTLPSMALGINREYVASV